MSKRLINKYKNIILFTLTIFIIGLFGLFLTNSDTFKTQVIIHKALATVEPGDGFSPDPGTGGTSGDVSTLSSGDWFECMQQALQAYMDAIIQGLADAGVTGVQVGTPVWNSSNEDDYAGFNAGGGGYTGSGSSPAVVMANVYNVDTAAGRGMYYYCQNIINDNPEATDFNFTEIGMNEFATGVVSDRGQALQNLYEQASLCAGYAAEKGVNLTMDLFAALGSGGGNWSSYALTADEIQTLAGAIASVNSNVQLGINPGAYMNMTPGSTDMTGYIDHLIELGLIGGTDSPIDHVVGIINTNIPAGDVANMINYAAAHGITTTLRIGVGMDSGGFSDPQALVDYIVAMVAAGADPASFVVIAGPNEPDLEGWLAIADILGIGQACGLPPGRYGGMCGNKAGMEELGMKTSVAGYFALTKEITQSVSRSGAGDPPSKPPLDSLSDATLASTFSFALTGTHDHEKVFDKIINFVKGGDDTNERTQDMNPPVLVRSAIPGVGLSPIYDQRAKAYIDPNKPEAEGADRWDVKSALDRWFSSSKSTIENIQIASCLQEVNISDDGTPTPIEGVPGQLFWASGTMDLEEPANIEMVSKASLETTMRIAGMPNDPIVYRFNDNEEETANNNIDTRNSYASNEIQQNLTTDNNQLIASMTKTSELLNPKKTKALDENGQLILADFSFVTFYSPGNLSYMVNLTPNDCSIQDNSLFVVGSDGQTSGAESSVGGGLNGNVIVNFMSGTQYYPSLNVTISPGDCYNVTAHLSGSEWISNEGRQAGYIHNNCPKDYNASCDICVDEAGVATSSCSSIGGVVPPINCMDPCTWASWTVGPGGCQAEPPLRNLTDASNCANGNCSITQAEEITKEQFQDWCSRISTTPIGELFSFLFGCNHTAHYVLYAAPAGLAADYSLNRTTDMSFTQATTMIPGQNEDYYTDNVYDKGTVQIALTVTNTGDDNAKFELAGSNQLSFNTYYQKLTNPHTTANCSQVQSLNIPGQDMYEDYKTACQSAGVYNQLMAGSFLPKDVAKAPTHKKDLTVTIDKNDVEKKVNKIIKATNIKPETKVEATYTPKVVNGTTNEYKDELLRLSKRYPEDVWRIAKGESLSTDFKSELKQLIEKYEGENSPILNELK